jgi:predicted HAD superfamily Cof-like phosphohydrolase
MSNFFSERIPAFNDMYKMETIPHNVEAKAARLHQFRNMIANELDEGADIKNMLDERGLENAQVMMADWLGDTIVYCASESLRWGIPIEQVLQIIMDSNASKLQADGSALFIDGKLQKGPGYWKPEPKIKELLDDQSNHS